MRINNVLLVDDDSTILMIAEIALSKVGKWKVLKANSGAGALEVARNFQPDLILLDVMMPGMDGPTTFKNLQEVDELASVPVIFMTAKVQKSEVDSYKQLGAAGVITKPFDPMTLPAEIREILGCWSSEADLVGAHEAA